jgi:hypothetical protein
MAVGVALGLVPSCALDTGDDAAPAPADDRAEDRASGGETDDMETAPVCKTGRLRCHAKIRVAHAGGGERRISSHATTPIGLGAPDLQSAYGIDPTRLATSTKPTIAITDAYGYPELENDLGVYRKQYGLPACTTANGCLKIVNQRGAASPLPPSPPTDDDWTIETALDIQMASAACPQCNLLVLQADNNSGDGLEITQNTAVMLGATVISDSWGGPEQPDAAALYAQHDNLYFKHPGVAIFVAAGDAGFNNTVAEDDAPTGPDYPGTSAYTIAVGATRLVKDPTTARGWRETAWAYTPAPTTGEPDPTRGAGGSACSLSIPKPAYQSASPCQFKASADIAAVGDPATGLAVYNTHVASRGWISVGGTSASAPFVAGIFAATGNGAQSGAFIAANANKLFDVTSGSNGTCPGKTLLCNAAAGWDGPTGFGTPNVKLMMPGKGGGDGGSGDSDDGFLGGCAAGRSGGSGGGLVFGLGVALAALGARRRRAR